MRVGTDYMPMVTAVRVGPLTGSDSTELAVFRAPAKCHLTGAYLVDKTGVTGHTENYGIATLTNKGTAAGGSTAVATRSTNIATTHNITAYKPWELTLSTTAASLELAAGDTLALDWSEAGTGQDLGDATLVINWAYGTGAGQ